MAPFPKHTLFSSFRTMLFNSGNSSRPQDREAYLLLSSEARDNENESDEDGMPQAAHRWAPIRRWPPRAWMILLRMVGLSVLSIAIFALLPTRQLQRRTRNLPTPCASSASCTTAESAAQRDIDALYARQSTSLAQASSRYSLKTNRPPPDNYDKWFSFAQNQSCLIDEYDQIYRDFEPFYQLAEKDPGFFKKMVELAQGTINNVKANPIKDGIELKSGEFHRHSFKFTNPHKTLYNRDWPRTMKMIAHIVPDMKIILNGRDEPRVLFNIRDPSGIDMLSRALNVTDDTPFTHKPSPTSAWFKDEKMCILPNKPTGFTGDANNASAFLINSASTDFTTDFYPILSVTKITPCFSDILVPSEFYYSDSKWAPRYKYPSDIPWEQKQAKLYWRGASSGGWISDQDDYHDFPRFRLVDIGRNHTDLIDVAITVFQDWLCGTGCDADAIKKEYGITGKGVPREEVYKYKYVADVDGNSFSGRYFGLLRSGSLVFKSTVFSEYFNDWLQPFKHYIPILPDMSDLVEKLEWAVNNDAEARRIQESGRQFAERVLTDEQNDCYFALVLLEWARLIRYALPES